MARLAARRPARPEPVGVRVVIDARPMQEPDNSPLTAEYLDRLLHAFAAQPLAGESFVIVSRSLRPDPSAELAAAGLPVAGGRRVPPTTRVLRSAGLTLDSFLLRAAELGTAGTADEGAVFHTAGGAVPLASRLPVVATLLDMAPWELPQSYAASAAARFGHRLRARVLRDAARVIVCSRATAESARRVLHLPAERLAIVPLAVDSDYRAAGRDAAMVAEVRARLELPPRYLSFSGRYDARKDMRSLFEALAALRNISTTGASGSRSRRRARPAEEGPDAAGPPQLVMALQHAGPRDRDLVEMALDRFAIRDLVRVIIPATLAERAAVVAGSEAFVYPALSEATALPALEALSLGIPAVVSRAGALPETVGSAGIVVEPRDAQRMAAALQAFWDRGSLAEQLRRRAERRAEADERSWSDVARETRQVYAEAAALSRRAPGSPSSA